MKRNILFLFLMAISVVSYGQKKPKINNALSAVQEGNLGEAKEIVDAGIEHEKTRDDAKTWYYRGLVYAALDTTSNPQFANLANDPLVVAMEAFEKASQINEGSSELYVTGPNGLPVLKSQQIQTIWGYYLNKGVIAFQAQETEEAVKNFTRCQMVMPQDTTCFLYAGLAAQSGQDYETAAKNYYKLINDLDHHDPDVYNSLIYIESNTNENPEKALELIRQAKTKFPANPDLAKTEINLLIKLDKVEEAKTNLESAIAAEPENADLIFTLGVLRDETGDPVGAAKAYEQALSVNPEHYNSAFNLAVVRFNEARETIMERNALGMSAADMKKSKELDKVIIQQLEATVPHWEKVREIQPDDRTALEQLRYIYIQLKENEKVEEIQKEIEKYGYTEEEN